MFCAYTDRTFTARTNATFSFEGGHGAAYLAVPAGLFVLEAPFCGTGALTVITAVRRGFGRVYEG